MTPVSHGKPCAGNPHARFDEGASAPEEPRRKALLHKMSKGKAMTYQTNSKKIVANWFNSNERKMFYNSLRRNGGMRCLSTRAYEGYLDIILANIFKFVGIKSCDDLYLKGMDKELEDVKAAWMKIVETEFWNVWDFSDSRVVSDFEFRLYGLMAA